jgi:hypothetical protein
VEGNPFQGTQFEQDWLDGFKSGLVAPNAEISAPSPLTLEAQDAFNQGVSIGQMVNAALDPPPKIEGGFREVADTARQGLDLIGPLLSLRETASSSILPFAAVKKVRIGSRG